MILKEPTNYEGFIKKKPFLETQTGKQSTNR